MLLRIGSVNLLKSVHVLYLTCLGFEVGMLFEEFVLNLTQCSLHLLLSNIHIIIDNFNCTYSYCLVSFSAYTGVSLNHFAFDLSLIYSRFRIVKFTLLLSLMISKIFLYIIYPLFVNKSFLAL
jgi:hypothetical protein